MSDAEVRAAMERAKEIQQRYWRPDAGAKKRLLRKKPADLEWAGALRLLHLTCLETLTESPGREQLQREDADPEDFPAGEDRDLVVRLVDRLRSEASPYRPRYVAVWQGAAGSSDEREADLEGLFCNASLTHLGSLEVIRLDGEQRPVELAFIPLDVLCGAVFAPPALFRYGKLFFDDGRPDEVVLAPLLYGTSWLTSHASDQDGTTTRFLCRVQAAGMSIGVGHQDFLVGERNLFGLASIGEFMVALSTKDPRFDEKCRARGLDPRAVRRAQG